LVETIVVADYSLSDVLPGDDVSVEFSRVAAKQSPTIDPVLLVYHLLVEQQWKKQLLVYC
jgi:hypothetical protein